MQKREYVKLRPFSERVAEIVVYSKEEGYSFPGLETLKKLRKEGLC